MKKRVLALFLAVMMFVGLMPVIETTAEAADAPTIYRAADYTDSNKLDAKSKLKAGDLVEEEVKIVVNLTSIRYYYGLDDIKNSYNNENRYREYDGTGTFMKKIVGVTNSPVVISADYWKVYSNTSGKLVLYPYRPARMSFDPNGGKIDGSRYPKEVKSDTFDYTFNPNLVPEVTAPDGYEFVGWYDAATGGNKIDFTKSYEDIFSKSSGGTSSATIQAYAQYEEAGPKTNPKELIVGGVVVDTTKEYVQMTTDGYQDHWRYTPGASETEAGTLTIRYSTNIKDAKIADGFLAAIYCNGDLNIKIDVPDGQRGSVHGAGSSGMDLDSNKNLSCYSIYCTGDLKIYSENDQTLFIGGRTLEFGNTSANNVTHYGIYCGGNLTIDNCDINMNTGTRDLERMICGLDVKNGTSYGVYCKGTVNVINGSLGANGSTVGTIPTSDHGINNRDHKGCTTLAQSIGLYAEGVVTVTNGELMAGSSQSRGVGVISVGSIAKQGIVLNGGSASFSGNSTLGTTDGNPNVVKALEGAITIKSGYAYFFATTPGKTLHWVDSITIDSICKAVANGMAVNEQSVSEIAAGKTINGAVDGQIRGYSQFSVETMPLVTFDANGGTFEGGATTKKMATNGALDKAYVVESYSDEVVESNANWPVPTREGYKFVHWSYDAEQDREYIADYFNADTNLYAVWKVAEPAILVDGVQKGGTYRTDDKIESFTATFDEWKNGGVVQTVTDVVAQLKNATTGAVMDASYITGITLNGYTATVNVNFGNCLPAGYYYLTVSADDPRFDDDARVESNSVEIYIGPDSVTEPNWGSFSKTYNGSYQEFTLSGLDANIINLYKGSTPENVNELVTITDGKYSVSLKESYTDVVYLRLELKDKANYVWYSTKADYNGTTKDIQGYYYIVAKAINTPYVEGNRSNTYALDANGQPVDYTFTVQGIDLNTMIVKYNGTEITESQVVDGKFSFKANQVGDYPVTVTLKDTVNTRWNTSNQNYHNNTVKDFTMSSDNLTLTVRFNIQKRVIGLCNPLDNYGFVYTGNLQYTIVGLTEEVLKYATLYTPDGDPIDTSKVTAEGRYTTSDYQDVGDYKFWLRVNDPANTKLDWQEDEWYVPLLITKADHADVTIPTVAEKLLFLSGSDIIVDLSDSALAEYIEKGAVLSAGSYVAGITTSFDGLKVTIKTTEDLAVNSITVPVTVSSTNYNDYTLNIPVEILHRSIEIGDTTQKTKFEYYTAGSTSYDVSYYGMAFNNATDSLVWCDSLGNALSNAPVGLTGKIENGVVTVTNGAANASAAAGEYFFKITSVDPDDSTKVYKTVVIKVVVDKREIKVPTAGADATYDGNDHTYVLGNTADNAWYTVSNNTTQKNAGAYQVVVELTDKVNTVWDNGGEGIGTNTNNQIFTFTVKKAAGLVNKTASGELLFIKGSDVEIALGDLIPDDANLSSLEVGTIVSDATATSGAVSAAPDKTGEKLTVTSSGSADLEGVTKYTIPVTVTSQNYETYVIQVTVEIVYKTVTVEAQQGTLTFSEPANVTYTVKNTALEGKTFQLVWADNVPDEVKNNVTIAWDAATVSANSNTLTLKTNENTPSGTYGFKVVVQDGQEFSDEGTITINKKQVGVPGANTTTFTFSGNAQTYAPVGGEANWFTLSNNVQTNAGTYTVTVALKDKVNTVWADSQNTTDKTFTFTINKREIQAPTAGTGATYDQKAHTFVLGNTVDSVWYTVSDNTTQTKAGTYVVTITLKDKVNTVWDNGTTGITENTTDVKYDFVIKPAVVEIRFKDFLILNDSALPQDFEFELLKVLEGDEVTFAKKSTPEITILDTAGAAIKDANGNVITGLQNIWNAIKTKAGLYRISWLDYANGDAYFKLEGKDASNYQIKGIQISSMIINPPIPNVGGNPVPPAEEDTTCPKDATCPIHDYADSSTTAWYHDGVHYCLENGLMVGLPGMKFAPDGKTTRAQIVTILWRMEGSPKVNYEMTFEDVAEGEWYTEAIRWAQSTGVVEGFNEKTFAPGNAITREQMATILYRYCKYKGIDVSEGEDTNILSYKDISEVSSWAMDAMQWACGTSVIQGVENNGMYLDPKGDAVRSQIATMIYRFCVEVLGK